MKPYDAEHVFNVALVSHGGAGKTTLVEAVRVADAGLVLVDGVSGAQVGTEQVWRALDERSLPRLVVVNKLDRENADYDRVLDQLRERYGKGVVPLTIPVGRENNLRGVVDLLNLTAYLGGSAEATEVPAEAADALDRHREALVEA